MSHNPVGCPRQAARLAGAIALVAFGLLVGCSKPSVPPRHHQAKAHRFGRVDYIAFFRRPGSFVEDERLLEDAEHRITERCLAKMGHRVVFAPTISTWITGRVTPNLSFRRRYGYGFAEPRQQPPQERWPTSKAASHRVMRMYFGDESKVVNVRSPMRVTTVGTQGCIGEARKTVYGSVKSYVIALRLPQDWSAFIGQKVGADPAYLGAPMRRWSRCMAKRGYHYKDLNGPYLDVHYAFMYAKVEPKHASATERRLAVADGECQISTRMPAVTRYLQDKYVDALPVKDQRELVHIAEVRAKAVATAHAIIAKYGDGS